MTSGELVMSVMNEHINKYTAAAYITLHLSCKENWPVLYKCCKLYLNHLIKQSSISGTATASGRLLKDPYFHTS